jgi:AraC-like DNA-binding protein
MDDSGVNDLLEALDIRVEALAVCQIGRTYSLRCEPIDQVLVHFVLKGEGFLECEHGQFPLSTGTLIVVPKRLPKRLRGSGPIEHVRDAEAACQICDGLVSFEASDGEADLLLGCAVLSTAVGGELPLFDHIKYPLVQKSDDPALQDLFGAMLGELSRPRLGTRAFVSALMKQVIIVLLRSPREGEAQLLLPIVNGKLAGVVAAVLQRPQDVHTVESLAAKAGMSRARFSHHFSGAYQCSPKAFVQSVRLASAARLLKASNLPVKSVAASVGFASRSHFSRAFQAKYGVDPSAFRQVSSGTSQ